ncbi:ABC transporter substrate-binding protein [Paenibacillus mucilaginosus]|uniref:NMT1/THI5 like domain protein n=1 Tax=Paenibacillus mucilaginosus (strain KNP414) TaxID=1036673 RepID=F8FDD0_PAEMK|nr:ABC transporter substrate-binding protein [Paenibacillus mucilaginosus]AEI41790.1 NMT1/THI5 like domain protein [Paenibacillus mucilaginosus KNP414]MCG7214474.1 ABC transporter substrate-binding protein [Paenibacillus mucilaginosus]WDM30756.1 ABC transporter substrate-binding protein [Paenibacillus mucilaginosus]
MNSPILPGPRTARRPASSVLALLLLGFSILTGCASKTAEAPATEAPKSGGAAPAAEKKLVAVTQVTNWFAEPEHGGNYAALAKGFYKEAGLDMTIQPGGPGVSATQIVASGKAQFGMGQADEILFARQNGIPLVAILAAFQKNPQGIMVHKDQNIKDIAGLNGRKVYVGSGVAYWEYMKKAYKLDAVQELKYTGSLANFVSDKTAATQVYLTSEPFTMKKQGIETEVLLNADFGYNPYANVMFTTESFLKENPEVVKSFVEATVKGWDYYKDHASEIHPSIQEKNPDLPIENMDYGAEAQKPLVYGGDAETKGVGYMTMERWDALAKQLVDIGLLKADVDPAKAFTVEYLPKK